MNSTFLGFFSGSNNKAADQTVESIKYSAQEANLTGADDSTIPTAKHDFVTLQMFLDQRYDPEAIDEATGKRIWLEIPKKQKPAPARKTRRTQFALNYEKPEEFLAFLAQSRTSIIARTLKANRHKLAFLRNAVQAEPNNTALYACVALLTDDITKLDLGCLIAAEQFLKNNEAYRRLAKTIDVMIELRNPLNQTQFAESLKKRNTEDYYLNLAGMTFSDIEFSEANLNYAFMHNATFNNTSFKTSMMQHAIFHSARFTDVKFYDVDLYDAVFCKAKFLRFETNNNCYHHTTFISNTVKLEPEILNKCLNGLFELKIPPHVVLENVYRNLANKSLRYTVVEKHALLGVLGVHDLFNSEKPEPEYRTIFKHSALSRKDCRDKIQKDWEKLAIVVSSTLNKTFNL